MNRKVFFYILSFFFTTYYSQTIQIKIVDSKTKKEIDSVRIYDKNGFLSEYASGKENNIQVKENDSLTFLKSGYEDIKIDNRKIMEDNVIYLNKNKIIDIEEVIVTKQNIPDVIAKIIEAEKNVNRKKSYYHLQYDFNDNDEIIQHYDGRISKNADVIKLEKTTDFIDNMNRTMVFTISGSKKKEKYLLQNTNYSNINQLEMYPKLWRLFLKNKKSTDYQYKSISGKDQYCKIEFTPINNDGWSYRGFIIYDKNDYKVYELKMQLIPNKKNLYANLLSIRQDYFIKTKKDDSEINTFDYATFDENFTIINGQGKGQNLKAHTSIERTLDFDDKNFMLFDMTFFKPKN